MGKRKELLALISLAGKVDPSLQQALLKASNQVKKTQKTISGQTSMMAKGMSVLKRVGAGALAGVAALGATAIVAFTSTAKAGIDLASDLIEVQNVVDVTFGNNAKAIDEWSKTTLEAYGLSQLKAKEYASSLGSMFKASNLSADQTMAMSQNITSLIGDFASFKNLTNDEAFTTIMSLLSGEIEPGRKYGIDMRVENLEEFAKLAGYKEKFADMSQAEKQLVRYNYLMQATADAQGDFDRTRDTSFANQQRLLGETFNELSAKIMQNAMPALLEITSGLINFMQSFDTKPLEEFVRQLGQAAVGLLPVLLQVIPILTQTLSTLMPFLTQLAAALAPALNQVFMALFEAIQPVLGPLLEIVTMLLPPLVEILSALMQILGPMLKTAIDIVKYLVEWMMPIIEQIADRWQKIADLFNKYVGWVKNIFFSGDGGTGDSDGSDDGGNGVGGGTIPAYAYGGFTNRPSIFGDDGLEAAIPIKPGNNRSINLLNKTASLLGAAPIAKQGGTDRGGVNFTYAPVFHGESREEIEPMLRRHSEDMRDMIEDMAFREERLSYG